ncbi:MAG: hypothetical protein WEC33_04210 [Dehalococcoidia bacterium]
MSELRADPLSPIDAATLWPQLGRLGAELATGTQGESLFVSSSLAATGLSRLPKLPKTVVLGVRRGLRYRGVLVARELATTGWEIVSLRIARQNDCEALAALLGGCGLEIARRDGRTVYFRCAEDITYRDDLRRAGFFPYTRELLYQLPPRPNDGADWVFRPAQRIDRQAIFRLYCRVVPEHIRRNEAPVQQDWRAVHASYDCDEEFVLEADGAITGWLGLGGRETHLLFEPGAHDALEAALDLTERHSRGGLLVLPEYQFEVERLANERGYHAAGSRLVNARRLALLQPLKEVLAVPADSYPVPQ